MKLEIEIRKLGSEDIAQFKELVHLFEQVFRMKNFVIPGDDHLKDVLSNDGFIAFVALLSNQVVGGLTAYCLQQYYSKRPLVYIYDLAVSDQFQRRGIGRELIEGITNHCRENGMEEVFVQADKEDVHALEFYRSTGGLPEDVVHFSYALNM